METRFGADFGGVRVHDGARAAESAAAVGAHAYAVGTDVVFGAGKYAPGATAGRRLLAHELAHVVQGRAGAASALRRKLDCRSSATPEAAFAHREGGRIWGFESALDRPGGPGRPPPTESERAGESNELTLWNFCVGESTPRPEHEEHLARQVPRWRSLLLAGEGPHRRGTDARIRITGTASKSGDPAANQALALARARGVRDLLEIKGVPATMMDPVAVGTQLPLADESVADATLRAENQARNRRVEVTFVVPTVLSGDVGLTPGEMPVVSALRFKRSSARHFESDAETVHMTVGVRGNNATPGNPSVGGVTATGQASGVRRGVAVGFLQILTDDFRGGVYHPDPDPQPLGGPDARDLNVDLSPCVRPFLPCRDIEESTHRFSHDTPGATVDGNRSASGPLLVRDAPGTVWARRMRSGGRTWRLERGTWSMRFVVILGVFRGGGGVGPSRLLALHHARWGFFAQVEPGGVQRLDTSGDDAFQPGAPPGVDVAAASTSQTCRMILRGTNLSDPTTGDRPCRGREAVEPRPPI